MQPITADPEQLDLALQSATLSNGLTLVVATRRHLPYVALSFATRGAGTFESPCNPEVLQLTARVIVEGGTIWTDGSAVEPFCVNGRGIGFEVGADHTHVDLPVLRDA